MKQFNSNYTYPNGEPIPNWNFNPSANIDSGFEIPFYDLNGDGNINVTDVVLLVSYIVGNSELSESQKRRLPNNDVIDVIDIVALMNILIG